MQRLGFYSLITYGYYDTSVFKPESKPLCIKFGLNGLVSKYEKLSEEYEQKAVELLKRISRENGELALLLIRRELPLLGGRSMVDIANFGELQEKF